MLWDITASYDNFWQPVRALLKKNFLWETDELKADMPEWLEISTKDGKPFMVSNLLLQQGNEETPSYIIGSSTKFWVEWQHLLILNQ